MKVPGIEDNPTNMKLILSVLQKHVIEPIQAVNGVDGIEKARQCSPDLLLMDIILHGMDCLETARQIKNINNMKDVKIIAITSKISRGG